MKNKMGGGGGAILGARAGFASKIMNEVISTAW